jgi:hypothetical protein
MTRNTNDERIAREQAQAHPPSIASMFGEDLGPPVYGDVGPSHFPLEHSSAAKHAHHRQQRELAAAARRDLQDIARAADQEADELALADATRAMREGRDVPTATRLRAARAARAKGTRLSSAEQLAARYRRGA